MIKTITMWVWCFHPEIINWYFISFNYFWVDTPYPHCNSGQGYYKVGVVFPPRNNQKFKKHQLLVT